MCTGSENSKPIWNKFIIRKDIIETSQVVLNFCRTVYKHAIRGLENKGFNIYTNFFPAFNVRFIQGSILFRVLWRQVYTWFHFIQGSLKTGLYRVPFYSGFSGDRFIQGSILFRVLWKQVYTGFHFIQGSLETDFTV